jgi:basic membrane protein A
LRRVTKIAAAGIASAALALTATACGSSSKDTSSSPSSSGSGLKVGVAYDVGGRGDHSFNDSAAAGLDKAKADFGITVKELTAKTADTDADRETRLEQLAGNGYNPVIAIGYSYGTALTAAAKKYPNVHFGIVDSVVDAKNVDSMLFTAEQSSYLAGVAAALKTKTNKVGFIGGVDIPLIKTFQAGFDQGVADTNPKVKVTAQYLSHGSDLSGFADPAKGKEAAQGMLDKGIDVIYSAAGSSGNGSIEAVAGKSGTWAIGVDSDQYADSSLAKYKNSILTSALKNVNVAVYDLVKSVKAGTPLSGTQNYSLAKGGVGLSYSGGFIDNIKTQLDAATKKIVNGDITVKTS